VLAADVIVPSPPKPVVPPLLLAEPMTDPHGAPWLPEAPPKPRGPRGLQRAGRFLEVVGAGMTRRIANEELGDALERLDKVAGAGAPAWVLYAMAGVSAFWAATHAAQELVLGLSQKVKTFFWSEP
jgi:hypothetical protein